MKTLVIPDIHNNFRQVKELINAENDWDEVVMLGDWFDSWYDSLEITERTANFLKSIIHRPNYHFLYGNHDIGYAYPDNRHLTCSGFSREKSKLINSIISKQDWNIFKLYYKTQDWYLSHAGITNYVFAQPIHGITDQYLYETCTNAMQDVVINEYNEVLGAGRCRGGSQQIGGILWAHWSTELKPLPGIKQIVGHTQCNCPQVEYVPNKHTATGENWCIDCDSKFYGEITDGVFTAIRHLKD